ncbi:Cytochrome bd-I ubiquinol oxidase subunit 2 [Pseudobythopirellula maris]|uniref:Cytochrome bd-I ubiquinol oxidase subunit 2 n=1 Tax=Pseudobythopirellula maris TaxID=2527991 RepID=A0A5C5ZQP6_9BACT|nr:cytochrome d ubiquinol oxidase subunit II [Pseudobythopirellula maris]TWT89799.1 Cytochrome bd-I ubiquinol oxidase subunit 2 [Pseudobythopirellula maris]
MDYALLWFVLLGVLLAGYAVLDGFDLGVGMLTPVAKNDHERRILFNSIGPLWDGNEVWLVTFGGALFAAFPEAYATVFSGFYTALMAVLGALIFRAVSIEFRSKFKWGWWRGLWDGVFFLSSLVASLVFGVAIGGAMVGVPLDERGVMRATLMDQLGWYPLLVGAMTVALFAQHGALFLRLKTKDELRERVDRWAWRLHGAFALLWIAVTVATMVALPHALTNFAHAPWALLVPVLNVLAILNISRSMKKGHELAAFFSSGATILALVFLLGVAIFPNLVASSPYPEHSLTIHNAASSEKTLWIMSIIALLGMPCVLAYTTVVYWTFRGKVELDEHSY